MGYAYRELCIASTKCFPVINRIRFSLTDFQKLLPQDYLLALITTRPTACIFENIVSEIVLPVAWDVRFWLWCWDWRVGGGKWGQVINEVKSTVASLPELTAAPIGCRHVTSRHHDTRISAPRSPTDLSNPKNVCRTAKYQVAASPSSTWARSMMARLSWRCWCMEKHQ